MATIGNNNPTYADVAKRLDPNGKVDVIIEMLNEDNEVLNDATLIEGNLPTGHRTTVRTGLPSATWRKLNYGVAKSKSQTAQVQDSAGMLEAYAEVDKALADLNGNTAAFRLSEDRAFLEAMSQEMATTLFYGDTDVNPERFMGLAPRYNDLTTAANKVNILSGSGTGSDNTSIWLVNWDPNVCHLFYPKGSVAGWQHKDLGEETLTDAAGGYYQGYRTHYKWDVGLTLRDWRYVVRIANIDVTALTKDAATGADLIDLLIQALEQVKGMRGRTVFYANRTITSFLRRQILNANNVRLSMEEVYGKKSVAIDGTPIRKTDALLNTEATVS